MRVGEAFHLQQQGSRKLVEMNKIALTTLPPNMATNYIAKKNGIITSGNHY